MDRILIDHFRSAARPAGSSNSKPAFRIVNAEAGEIEFDTPAGAQRYMLKPLAELYGNGASGSSIDWKDGRFMPLLLGIEMEILVQRRRRD